MTLSSPFVSWDSKCKMPLVKTLKADRLKPGTALLIFKTVLLLIRTSMGMFDNSFICALRRPAKPIFPHTERRCLLKLNVILVSIVTR